MQGNQPSIGYKDSLYLAKWNIPGPRPILKPLRGSGKTARMSLSSKIPLSRTQNSFPSLHFPPQYVCIKIWSKINSWMSQSSQEQLSQKLSTFHMLPKSSKWPILRGIELPLNKPGLPLDMSGEVENPVSPTFLRYVAYLKRRRILEKYIFFSRGGEWGKPIDYLIQLLQL